MSVGIMASSVVAGGGVDVLLEPFNNFTAAPWTVASTPLIVAGRTGTAAECNSISDELTYTIPSASRSEWIMVGFAYRVSLVDTNQANILELYSDAGATRHNRLITNASTRHLALTRDTLFLVSSGADYIPAATWVYLEVKVRLGDAPNGVVIVRVNGTEVINATGLDTKAAGTNTVYESVRLLRAGSGKTNLYDDLYISTGAGAAFKGDITIGGGAVTLTQGAVGGGVYSQGGTAPEVRSLDLPDWAVTTGELLIVGLATCAGEQNPPANPFWSVTGGGLTWTRVEARNGGGAFNAQAALFYSVATSTTTITDMTGVPNSDNLQVMYSYAKATGYNTSTPIGATAALADGSTDGQKDITLSGTPAASSVIYAIAFVNMDDNNATKQIDHGASAGWTEAFDYGPSMTGTHMWGCWEGQHKTGHTTTTVRWDDLKPASVTANTYSFAGCAIEIKAA